MSAVSTDGPPSGENGADESDVAPGVDGGGTDLQGSESAEIERIDDLEAKTEAFGAALDAAWDEIEYLQEQLVEAEEERTDLEAENEDLRDEIDRLDARTDLLRIVRDDGDEMTAEQRQVALIQYLQKAARKQRERGREPKASVSPEQARTALHEPYADRTHVYHDMRRAAEILGNDDVLWYHDGGRGDTWLKMDLTSGDVPGSISGRGKS